MDNEIKNGITPDDGAEKTKQTELPLSGENTAMTRPSGTHGSLESELEEFYIDGDAPKKTKTTKKTGTVNTFITGMIKASVYITCIVIISVFLAVGIILIGNDVFALVKDDRVVEITVTESTTVEDLAQILYENEIIKYPAVFKVFAGLKDMTDDDIIPGTYKISPTMNYDLLTGAFKPIIQRKIVRLTIPEGASSLDIIDIFTKEGIGTREGFEAAINDFDYSQYFDWLKPLYEETDSKRYFRLEGYMYPDTYDFYSDASETQIIYKLLENFDAKFSEEMKADAAEAGYTIDELVIIASLVQTEAYYYEDYDKISSVFINRLKKPSTYPKLESDATISYAIEMETGKRPDNITGAELDYDSPYNTRKYNGMPPGAIANPGYEAIMCALYPAKTDYYYFVSNKQGYNVFSRTYAEHLKAVEAIRNDTGEDY